MATLVQAVRLALHYGETYLGVTDIFGEDVGPPLGGVFTATQGLKTAWNSPLDERGIVGAARTNDINTANCQWFVTLKKQPQFDKKYTVFGRVIDGIKNAEVIMNAPTQPGSERPSDKVVIKSVTLQPRASFPAQ